MDYTMGKPSLHGLDPLFDGVRVSDSEFIVILVGRDGLLPGGI